MTNSDEAGMTRTSQPFNEDNIVMCQPRPATRSVVEENGGVFSSPLSHHRGKHKDEKNRAQ
jgi:hypothetical protein